MAIFPGRVSNAMGGSFHRGAGGEKRYALLMTAVETNPESGGSCGPEPAADGLVGTVGPFRPERGRQA